MFSWLKRLWMYYRTRKLHEETVKSFKESKRELDSLKPL